MPTTEIMNGRITETRLGKKHDCLSADLIIEGDGWGGGFGDYILAHWSGTNKPTCGAGAIAELLKTLDLEKWEQLRGTYVRAKCVGGCGGEITAIGHIYKNQWFSFKEFFEKSKRASTGETRR